MALLNQLNVQGLARRVAAARRQRPQMTVPTAGRSPIIPRPSMPQTPYNPQLQPPTTPQASRVGAPTAAPPAQPYGGVDFSSTWNLGGNTTGVGAPPSPANGHPVDPTTFNPPDMADIFHPDMKTWLSKVIPGSYQYHGLPPMQRAWIDAYNAAKPTEAPTPVSAPPAPGTPPPGPGVAPPITHDPTIAHPATGGVVGDETNPPPSWYNTTMGGVPVHMEPNYRDIAKRIPSRMRHKQYPNRLHKLAQRIAGL